MKIELQDIDSVQPYDRNPRINDNAVDAIAASLREFGFRQPIVVDAENVIIVGHARYKAAVKMGLQKIPVHMATDLTPEQVRAYRIADNKTNELSDWDMDILPVEIAELFDSDFDVKLLAFDDKELTQLLNAGMGIDEGVTEADMVPEPPDEAITRRGDIWILGEHRLMCGDSADRTDIEKLMNGATVQLCNTDPPYNVRVEPRSNNAVAAGLSTGLLANQSRDYAAKPSRAKRTTEKLRPKDRPLANDYMSDEEFDRLLDAWFGNIVHVLDAGRTAYIWGGYANLANYPKFLKKHGLYLSQCIVWNKVHPVLTRKDFLCAYEMCYYCWKEGAAHQFFGPNNVPDLWDVKKLHCSRMVHLTEKPVELAVRAIQYSSKPGENVLEIFGGSGSTLIACEQTERKCYCIELDELYCDVIVRRWEEFTGKKAVHLPQNN
jgi:DNA modification methylase